MSGLGKIYEGVTQFLQGETSIFSLDAAALQISSLLYTMQETTVLGPFLVEHPLLGWLSLVGVIYLQFFAILIVFRPSLHRVWALGLILFHFGTYLAMRAIFVAPIAMIAIFLLASPFYQGGGGWRKTFFDVPLFGWVIRWVLRSIKHNSRR